MINIGTALNYGSPSELQLWLESADNISDPAIFLVREGIGEPALARVCREADMHNYPDDVELAPGWYRASGIAVTLRNSDTAKAFIDGAESVVGALDAQYNVTPDLSATETKTVVLRSFRIGDEIGTLNLSKEDRGDCWRIGITVTVNTDELSTNDYSSDLFVVSDSETFPELLRIRTPDDDVTSADTVVYTSSITVWLAKEKEDVLAKFLEALCTDIEDYLSWCTLE